MGYDDLPDEGFDDDYAGPDALNGGNDKEIATAASPAVATGPQRYRVRAAEVDALEWTGSNIAAMEAFAGPAFSYYEGEASLLGNPGGAWHPLDVGNYAIKGVTGEFFIIFGEDFADNYETIAAAAALPSPKLIGPLTAEEWCSLAMGDDDILQCCAITSAFRDDLFHLLRMGGGDPMIDVHRFRDAWEAMVEHGLPDGDGGPVLRKLHDYFLGAGLNAAEATR